MRIVAIEIRYLPHGNIMSPVEENSGPLERLLRPGSARVAPQFLPEGSKPTKEAVYSFWETLLARCPRSHR
uniref:Uncharacterized protein n=1 Tax=Oryzias latipes TaxID=8090 RepID=A0A3P9K5F1_ORYLA